MRLTAQEANIKSKESGLPYTKYLNDILVWIEQHSAIGLFEFQTPMKNTFTGSDLSKNEEALNYIISQLEGLGYVVSYSKTTTNLVVRWGAS